MRQLKKYGLFNEIINLEITETDGTNNESLIFVSSIVITMQIITLKSVECLLKYEFRI